MNKNQFRFRVYLAEENRMLYSEDWEDRSWAQIRQWQEAGLLTQATGLRDAAGCDIFEGDIVEVYNTYKEEVFRGSVHFGKGAFFIRKDDLTSHDRWINYDIRVIGNVFENPKMLIEQ